MNTFFYDTALSFILYIRTCSFTRNYSAFVGHLCGSTRV